MTPRTTRLIKTALSALYYTGAHKALAPLARGAGIIFMMHHVRPASGAQFEPNRILAVTPEFLDGVIRQVQAAGFDVVSLDEAHDRLVQGRIERPFACFTFDDGYRDNLTYAYPIFRRHNLPFAIYVPTDYADGQGDLWWLALEAAIGAVDEVRIVMNGQPRRLPADTFGRKQTAFHEVYWWLRSIDETEARRVVRELCAEVGVDCSTMCRDLVMSWDEIRALAGDPLVTIGAHTRSHYALAKLSYADARLEMEASIVRIEREIGRRPMHFSYPYGSEDCAGPREFQIATELGLKTAVTTRKGVLQPEHESQLTALPRVSLNGEYQAPRFVSVLMSGAPFFLLNGLRRFVPA